MGRLFRNLMSHPELIIFGLIIFGSVGSTIVRKIKEQAALRQIQQQRRQQQADALRTGPSAAGASTDADQQAETQRKARLAEIAAQRRAQLEQLQQRRQQMRQTKASTAAPPRTPSALPAQQTSRPPRPIPTIGAAPASPAAKQPRPARTAQPQPTPQPSPTRRRKPRPQARPQPQPAATSPGQRLRQHHIQDHISELEHLESPLTRGQIGSMPIQRSRTRSPSLRDLGGPLLGIDLRRAIMLSEIIGPPVSMRK